MKIPNPSQRKGSVNKSPLNAAPINKGTVRVAVWKDSPEAEKFQDVFTNYSSNVFFDFSKPLKLLESSGWSSSIKTNSDGDFFVFTSDFLDSNQI